MPCNVLNKIAKEFKEVGGEICISVNEEGILFEGQADLIRMRVKIAAQVPLIHQQFTKFLQTRVLSKAKRLLWPAKRPIRSGSGSSCCSKEAAAEAL